MLACLPGACGAKAPAQKAAPPPHAPPGVYDPARLDLDRPCTLVTEQDAAHIAGQPFYRTMAANVVEENSVRCGQGVGDFGLHGMVEIEVRYPVPNAPPASLFDIACHTPASASEIAQATPTTDTTAPPPAVRGRFCALQNGSYALLLPDRLLMMRVRLGAGEIDPDGSRRLASLVSTRVVRN